MLSRIHYAIKACWLYRKQLKLCMTNPKLNTTSILNLTPNEIFERGVSALVLDFDGVLASHAEQIPRDDVVVWLKNFIAGFDGHKIYILSNKPTKLRLDYFAQFFPEIRFIIAKRKKPYPDGLLQVIADSGLQPAEILLVDDRLATGIVAAMSTGVQYIWINKPYTDFCSRPVRESFFMFLRNLERFLLG